MDRSLQKQILRGLWVALLISAAVGFVYYALPLVSPFLFAWLIAYMLNPLVNLLQKRARLPRWLAVSISLLLFLGVSVGLITIAITNVVLEINDLSTSIQRMINDWKNGLDNFINSESIQSLINRIVTYYNENPQYQDTINSNLESTGRKLADIGSSVVSAILNGIVVVLTGLPNLATVIIVALLAAFFISKDWNKLKGKIGSVVPHFIKKPSGLIWADLQKALFGYLRAQLVLISITAVVVTMGLIILGVRYAVTIGFLIGLVDLMPYLGTGTAMVPWIIVVFFQGNVYLGVGLSILYGIILVTRQILEPKILSTSIGLAPLPTLMAMYIGLKLFGFLGLIIGPASLMLLASFHRAGVFRDIWTYITSDGKAG